MSTQSKQTPGPWVVQSICDTHDRRASSLYIKTPPSHPSKQDGRRICQVSFDNWSNARLIAAAPELMEALNRLLLEVDNLTGPSRTVISENTKRHLAKDAEQARAAIAKAEGRA